MKNRKCWTTTLCLLTLLGGSGLWAAEPERQTMKEVRAKMKAEGWTEISEGVFERQMGPNKVEHLGYGKEGLLWTLGDLTRRHENLKKEYEKYPSEKLANIIEDLNLKIGKTRRELWNLERDRDRSARQSKELLSLGEAVTGGSCGNICYSATADAYELTATQGVAAVADAKFNSTCGYSGDTYAYAYARATQGTTTTVVSQADPRTGTSVNSHAVASVNGGSVSGTPCYSEASAYAQSSALGIHYSTSDSNNSCPAPACTVTISGTSFEYFTSLGCVSRTWTASASGCTAYSYQWKKNGAVVGTNSSTYTQNVCASGGSFTLDVTVNGGAATDSHYVDVYYEYCECCDPRYICP